MFRLVAALFLVIGLSASAGPRLVGRARVTDGDTLRVGGVAVRLKGLAAPEVAHGGDPGEPGGIEAKAFMVEPVEDQTVVCDLIKKRTHGRRVGWCYRDGEDITEALIRAGLARDCPQYSGGRYAAVEPAAARESPSAGVLSARLVAGSR